jgi:alkylhydroperoxidase/carboxymuconolactone decarboxylase family protein YurZ
MKHTTDGFELFMKDTNGVGAAFMSAIMKLAEVSALDKKVHELAYISVLVTSKMYEGLPYHIAQATAYGATLDELKSAILLPMPIVGLQVVEALTYLEKNKE